MDEWVHAMRRPGEALADAKLRLERSGVRPPPPRSITPRGSDVKWGRRAGSILADGGSVEDARRATGVGRWVVERRAALRDGRR